MMKLSQKTKETIVLSENMKMLKKNKMKLVSKQAVVVSMGVSKMMLKKMKNKRKYPITLIKKLLNSAKVEELVNNLEILQRKYNLRRK